MRDIEWVLRHAEEVLVTINRLENEVDALRTRLSTTNFINDALRAELKRPLWRKMLGLS